MVNNVINETEDGKRVSKTHDTETDCKVPHFCKLNYSDE